MATVSRPLRARTRGTRLDIAWPIGNISHLRRIFFRAHGYAHIAGCRTASGWRWCCRGFSHLLLGAQGALRDSRQSGPERSRCDHYRRHRRRIGRVRFAALLVAISQATSAIWRAAVVLETKLGGANVASHFNSDGFLLFRHHIWWRIDLASSAER